MKAIQIHQTGGPEVLTLAEIPIPTPGPGQVLVKIAATGVNFIEIYFREGRYKAPLPLVQEWKRRELWSSLATESKTLPLAIPSRLPA